MMIAGVIVAAIASVGLSAVLVRRGQWASFWAVLAALAILAITSLTRIQFDSVAIFFLTVFSLPMAGGFITGGLLGALLRRWDRSS